MAVNLWLLDHPQVSGIYNCGTGRYQSYTQADMRALGQVGYDAHYLSMEQSMQRYNIWFGWIITANKVLN